MNEKGKRIFCFWGKYLRFAAGSPFLPGGAERAMGKHNPSNASGHKYFEKLYQK